VEILSLVAVLCAFVVAVVRFLVRQKRVLQSVPAKRIPTLLVGLAGAILFAATAHIITAGEPKAAGDARPEGKPAVKTLVTPKNWPEDYPLPRVGSNCVACHLTAGRELTAAAKNFVRSVHDMQDMTCYDCHGGNTVDDVKAHEGEFGFIGTKKSAHIAGCSECHTEAAEALAAGPHDWDFSKRINTEYPMCFDCHGNHDIGNPPADFKLAAMCADCHDKLEKRFPNLASVVNDNDRLWEVMRQVRNKNLAKSEPVPPMFQKEVAALRTETMQVIHTVKEIPADRAAALNKRVDALRTELEKWLQSAP